MKVSCGPLQRGGTPSRQPAVGQGAAQGEVVRTAGRAGDGARARRGLRKKHQGGDCAFSKIALYTPPSSGRLPGREPAPGRRARSLVPVLAWVLSRGPRAARPPAAERHKGGALQDGGTEGPGGRRGAAHQARRGFQVRSAPCGREGAEPTPTPTPRPRPSGHAHHCSGPKAMPMPKDHAHPDNALDSTATPTAPDLACQSVRPCLRASAMATGLHQAAAHQNLSTAPRP